MKWVFSILLLCLIFILLSYNTKWVLSPTTGDCHPPYSVRGLENLNITISDKEIHNADRNIEISSTIDEIYPFLTAVVGQLLAYHVADILEKDIDKPRNLAKSVTVK